MSRIPRFSGDRFVQPGGMLVQQPMPAPVQANPTASAVLGKRDVLPRVPAGGGTFSYDLNARVGLVRSEKIDWGPWSVTLDALYPQATPWPVVGLAHTGRPRAIVAWGVGGARREIEMDYPTGGGAFVLNADAIDVAVRATVAENSAAPLGVMVGAWLTPGCTQGEPAPMVLTEADSVAAANVPPFARYLVVEPYDAGAGIFGAGEVSLRFTDPSTLVQWWAVKQYAAGAAQQGTFRARVPPLATRVDITVTTTPNWTAYWELALA